MIRNSSIVISEIVYISSVWSLWMVANRAIREDRLAFKEEYQRGGCTMGYIIRCLYRMIDVLYRLFVLLIVWLFLSGYWIILILLIESIVFIILCKKTNELSCVYFFLVFIN